jgi:hypothetical protein
MVAKAFLDLPPDFIVEAQVEIAADQQRCRDREQQAPLENRPAEVDQSRENRHGPQLRNRCAGASARVALAAR